MICTDFREYGEDNVFLTDDFVSYDELFEAEYISWCAYYVGGDAAPGNLLNTDAMNDQAIVAAHWPDDYIFESGLFVRGELLENASEREEYYQAQLEDEDDESDEEDDTESTQG